VRHQPPADSGAARFIVKYRTPRSTAGVQAQAAESRDRALARRTGLILKHTREIGPDLQAFDLDPGASGEARARLLARLRADSGVEFAEIDYRRQAQAMPDDPRHDGQWYEMGTELAAVDAETAWDTTTGSKGVVVAVLDTGVRFDHPDLGKASEAGRLLSGYDFISVDTRTANDGNLRDADPSDPGDWISQADVATDLFKDCDVADSSWHGTRVSGIIGALSNNDVGVAGMDWKAWILPVRVLGKCGGYDSDVIAGMRWAAGQHVNGVPDNPYPARILNMSLGAVSVCTQSYRDVISELNAAGVSIVVSAGNEGGPVDSPANCPGVIGVAGLRHAGTKVGFSSLGPEISIAAPSGNCLSNPSTCTYSLDTTFNRGTTGPAANDYTDKVMDSRNIGTSFSAPIVSGIAALMSAVNGNLKSTQLRDRLRGSALPFPHAVTTNCHVPASASDIQDEECNCTTSTCGAGMANARAAVTDALRPIAAISVPGSVAAGQDVSLEAGGSAAACGSTIASYSWEIVDPGANPPTINDANTATASVTAPATDPFIVRVTVTDDAGRTDTADVTINPTSAETSAPATAGSAACPTEILIAQTPPVTEPPPTTPPVTPSKSGDGGGGVVDPWLLLAELSLAARAAIRRDRIG
jgi:serine protease